MMVRDLITVEQQLGFDYRIDGLTVEHYQQICPKCRRAMLGLAQGAIWSAARNTELNAAALSQPSDSNVSVI
jgi:hypothetical protein